jgi:hypothetical protein
MSVWLEIPSREWWSKEVTRKGKAEDGGSKGRTKQGGSPLPFELFPEADEYHF